MHGSADGLLRIYHLGNLMNKGKRRRARFRRRYAYPRIPATSTGIVVESASALDAETPLVGVLAQELTGTCWDAIAHGGVALLDGQHDIQADAVHEPKGGHAGASEDLPHGVNVLGRRDTFLDDHEALALDRGPDAVEDEPVALPAHPEGHQPVVGDLLHKRFDDLIVGLAARHQLDRVELRRLLIVGVQHTLGMLDLADHLAGGIEEELLHRIASGSASRSSTPKTSVLMSRLSGTASITIQAPATASCRSPETSTRPRRAGCNPSVYCV